MLGAIIDTSADSATLGLIEGNRVLQQKILKGGKTLSSTLMPAIQDLLRDQTIGWIAVGTGPGSYTGTRVGVSIARALSFAMRVPLVSFCSLAAFIPLEQGSFVSWMEAKEDSFFALKGTVEHGNLKIDSTGMYHWNHWEELVSDADVLLNHGSLSEPWLGRVALLIADKLRSSQNECHITYLHA